MENSLFNQKLTTHTTKFKSLDSFLQKCSRKELQYTHNGNILHFPSFVLF